MQQDIRFCLSPDGVNLAYAKSGSGYPIVRVGTFLTHLEYDWESPIWRPWLDNFSRFNTLYRYDVRGCGLSDRDIEDFSLEALLSDIETVVDAAGLERFALFGMSQGGPAAIWYAIKHPERVSHVIIYGSYLYGPAHYDPETPLYEEYLLSKQMFRLAWKVNDPGLQRWFPTTLLPEGTTEQIKWLADLQQVCTIGENASKVFVGYSQTDIRDIASQLSVPCLILHARHEQTVIFDRGRELATYIPNARLIPLNSKNHILLPSEPAWRHFWQQFYDFLDISPEKYQTMLRQIPQSYTSSRFMELTQRERDVLNLIAKGYRNDEIASELVLSPKTIRNYVSRVFEKLDVSSRGEAIVLAQQGGFGSD